MVNFRTYAVCVKVDDERLPEFDVEVDEGGKRVTCWIPSEAGKVFSVHYSNGAPLADGVPVKRIQVFLDGVSVGWKSVKVGYDNMEETSGGMMCVPCGNGAFRKFMFAACQLTDDDGLLVESETRRLGEIEIKVFAAVEVAAKQAQPADNANAASGNDKTLLPPLKVHEKAKKAIVHGAQLSDLMLRKTPVPSKSSKRAYRLKDNLVTFVFRYRPIDMLQANGIAPLPPKALVGRFEPTDVIDLTLSNHEDEDEDDGVRDAEIAAPMARIEALEGSPKPKQTQTQTQLQPTRKRVKVEEEEDAKPVIKREKLS